jgi:hypothetical protein
MERLVLHRNELLDHAAKAANLLDTGRKTIDAQRRQIVSADEARELCVSVLSEASMELAKAVELIARAIPHDKEA